MKKSLFFVAAASALMLTACSSESDVVQNTTQTQQQTVVNRAVGFDIYTPAATGVTRAGLVGTMTTTRMQRSEQDGGGFGVYAFLTEDTDGSATTATAYTPTAGQDPNFMFNEKVLWNSDNLGWYYNPLKYWPNETNNDSQADPASMQSANQSAGVDNDRHLDRLTFFAYAPYVPVGSGTTGITKISDNTGSLNSTDDVTDPTIKYVSTNKVGTPTDQDAVDVEPNDYVDLLWGVAPAGGLSYTAVNGTTVTVDEGKPLINMIKPNVNTSMKFLFNHALARFGITVVAAIDQVSPGGELDSNTKITINSLKITGPFGITGELNLNNGNNANIANWTKIQTTDVVSTGLTPTKAISTAQSITVNAQETQNAIAEHLRYVGSHTTFGSYSAQDRIGVTTAKQDLLRPSNKWYNKLASTPAYNPGKKYYSNATGTVVATAQIANNTKAKVDNKWGYFYTKDGSNNFVLQAAAQDAPVYPSLKAGTPVYFVKPSTTVYKASAKPAALDDGTKMYKISNGDGMDGSTEEKAPKFVYVNTAGTAAIWDNTTKYYTLEDANLSVAEIPYAYSGDIYEAERNYIYVVPTNNVAKNCTLPADAGAEKALRTITVQIEYYITTEDSKVQGDRTQTKNVITKEVVLPSLANSKSYNLNLVLGLTSVKIEAEVDDWKVVNSQVDLPQNTAE